MDAVHCDIFYTGTEHQQMACERLIFELVLIFIFPLAEAVERSPTRAT